LAPVREGANIPPDSAMWGKSAPISIFIGDRSSSRLRAALAMMGVAGNV
jgi:hypothetical protein